MKTALTFAIMDAPFENSRTVTVFRIIEAALMAGHDVNVFAYEGAVALSFARQAPHANAVHGRDAAAENHPLPRVWIEALLALAAKQRPQARLGELRPLRRRARRRRGDRGRAARFARGLLEDVGRVRQHAYRRHALKEWTREDPASARDGLSRDGGGAGRHDRLAHARDEGRRRRVRAAADGQRRLLRGAGAARAGRSRLGGWTQSHAANLRRRRRARGQGRPALRGRGGPRGARAAGRAADRSAHGGPAREAAALFDEYPRVWKW